jgi:pimeloyl-ACP methyl ester carboxylesterase
VEFRNELDGHQIEAYVYGSGDEVVIMSAGHARPAASDFPDRCSSKIFVGAGGNVPPSQEIQDLYAQLVDPNVSPEEWTRLNTIINYAPGNEHIAATASDLGIYTDVARSQMAAIKATPYSQWEVGGNAPMLVIVGLQDRMAVPENGLIIATERPNTSLIGLANCGHNMIDEQPEELRRVITDFVRRNSISPTD